jgi:hypothetical protein
MGQLVPLHQGMRDLANVFTAKERSDLLDTMKAKGIHVRTDVYEVKLEMLADFS